MHKIIPIIFLLLLSCFLLFGCTGKSVAINDTKVITIVDVNGFTHNITLGDLNDVSVSGVLNGQALVYELATNSWVPGQVSATDKFVKVSATDTITNYLESKIAAGTNIVIAKLNVGANEQLSISSIDTNCDVNNSCKFVVYAQNDVNRLSNAVRYVGGLNIPTQSGQNGKFLQTNGTNVSWVTALTGVSWGIIVGDWNNQADLAAALNARANKGDVNLWGDQRYMSINTSFPDINFRSAGIYFKPTITNTHDGNITLGVGQYIVFADNNFTSPLTLRTVPGAVYTLQNNITNYITYNGDTNTIQVSTSRANINQSNVIPVVTVYREDNDLHLIDWDEMAKGLSNKLSDRLVRTERFAIEEGGLMLGERATRIVTLTSGVVWYGAVNTSLLSVDSNTDEMDLWYHLADGNWAKTIITKYDNNQYDSGTGLVALNPAKYAVNWIFRGIEQEKHLFVVLGQGAYSLSEAEASTIPPLPNIINSQTVLVGRIIVQSGDNNAKSIESAFIVPFNRTPVTAHDQLSNIQGGQFGEYYHLTLSEYLGTWGHDLNNGIFNIDTNWVYANVVWADRNRGYGTMYCVDGNIVIGYLLGYSC